MTTTVDQRFFFVHVMKTAGGTFREHVFANFEREDAFPDWRIDPPDAYFRIEHLRALPTERRAHTRAYTGHFPFVATELLGGGFVTLTILRDPIERTVSLLKQRQREREPDASLEEVYDLLLGQYWGVNYEKLVRNHQTKVFSMTLDDPLESYLDVIDVNEQRLEIAKANVEQVDVLGFQHRFGAFLDEMQGRFGWQFGPMTDLHVSAPADGISPSFRRRIADDNALDLEFYEHALRLDRERARSLA